MSHPYTGIEYASISRKFVAQVKAYTPEAMNNQTIGIYDTLDAAIQGRKQFLRERRRNKAVGAGGAK